MDQKRVSLARDFGTHKGRCDALKEFIRISPDELRKSLARELLAKEDPIAKAVLKQFMSTPTAQNLTEYHDGYDAAWKATMQLVNRL
jgi:hypothetical protein